MDDYGRRLVIDADVETTVGAVCRAIREEGLQVIGRLNVRDYFWRQTGQDFREYWLILAWSPDLALDGLRLELSAGTVLPTTFAVYEAADGETVVVAAGPMAAVADDLEWRDQNRQLADIGETERTRVAKVFDRLQHRRASEEVLAAADR